MSKETKNFLSIDFGLSQVGLAKADSETRIAFGLGTLPNDEDLLQEIGKIIEKEKIDLVIVGQIKQEGPHQKTKGAENLAREIELQWGVKVEFQEEMFSTRLAQRNLIEAGAKNIKKLDNQEAARVILESWLEKQAF